MAEDLLILQPANELIFNGPFCRLVTSKLTVKNRLAYVVVYRLLTSSKAIFCAEHHYGLLQPGETRILTICLNPGQHVHDYGLEVQCFISPGEDVNLLGLWSEVNPLMISRRRVTCMLRTEPDENIPLGMRLRRFLTSCSIGVKRFNYIEDLRENIFLKGIAVVMCILFYIIFACLVWKFILLRNM